MFKLLTVFALCLATPLAAAAPYRAELRYTALGIPQVIAADENGLGYGVGYAYARDNLCLLEQEVVTARGERARFFGEAGSNSAGLANVPSDVFFRWLNNDNAVAAFWKGQPAEVQALLQGYAEGFNRRLGEAGGNACGGGEWVRPLATDDLVRLVHRLMVEGGVGRFAEAMVAAQPPGNGQAAVAAIANPLQGFANDHGSNAIAVGGQRTENGKGRLLGNPHFPWHGALRFYQLHLTIPGKLDVMGAALPGLPVVNIGFNQHVAWTHTVDKSAHFTLQRLQLEPHDPTAYRVDGQLQHLRPVALAVTVRGADGTLREQHHTVYETDDGPVVNWPGVLDWTPSHAYVLKDANRGNDRALAQWYAMDQATSVGQLRQRIDAIQGIPWVNTLAADDQGDALYFNGGVVPNVPAEHMAACAIGPLVAQGLPAFDGSRRECGWATDPGAVQPGTLAGAHLPALQNRDYVQNANDSAWLANPATPLKGFSPLVSRDGQPLSGRTRFALSELALHAGKPLSEAFLQGLVTANRVYSAEQNLDDLLAFCASRRALQPLCDRLARWDRTAGSGTDAQAYVAFAHLMAGVTELDGAWRVPFDAADPIHTPRGVRWQSPAVATKLQALFEQAATQAAPLGNARWGEVQVASRGPQHLPVPGGDGNLGVYNAVVSEPAAGGQREVVSGSSYIQLVSFGEHGPVARGLLSFSQASDPASPHAADQTRLFGQQQWPLLPFSEAAIKADPGLKVVRLP